ncbi:hypothetical protein AMAG_17295 [Allomyces macrogynus ATCC 38327]|uniref:Cytochrome P450 n=1 Tax=Allomyces macrogynus (strain ATCC 38327) TaxID=578462 RepID=A0A0L0TEM8_ALLM3|nr:hypothetical protein AMAG_17295 [Allomyces macrogynus ATCC 38327]|eukprot:KNE73024.1 hypothetical protein AMAG_17295 [Allomyces macrogynus ATCC 38327]
MNDEKLTLNDIKLLMVDFMFAGIDTTSATLHWVMLYLCNNPHVQKRAQAEADRLVTTHGRLPCFEDMDAMPYTRAIIKEATRIRPVGPLGLPRQTIEEDTVAGYYIPKDAQVIYNTVGIHEGLYPEDTEMFKPERWLAANFNDSGNGPILPAAGSGRRRGSDLKTMAEDGAAPSSAPDEAGHRLDLLDGIYLFGQGRRLCPGERVGHGVHSSAYLRELEAIIKGDLAKGRDPRTDRELCYAEELLLTMNDEKLTLNDIKLLMVDFMFAGIDTTSATLHWVMLYLCNNPHVQKRAQAEADRLVTTHGRLPCFEDMDAMPYTRAIIKEATRIRPVGPLGLPRQTIEEDTVAGYYIPKDAQVIYNTVGIHEGLYPEDTEMFKPERWLAANFNDSGNGPILPAAGSGRRRGSDLKTMAEDGAAPSSAPDEAGHRLDLLDGIYLFGQGRRLCPGVHLALREMFILVSRLMACVTLDSALHPGKPFSDEAQFGLTALPKEKVLVTATERDPAMREMLNMEKRQVMKRRVSLSVHT